MRHTRLAFFIIIGLAAIIVIAGRWASIVQPAIQMARTDPATATPISQRQSAELPDLRKLPSEEPLLVQVRDVIPVHTSIGSVYFVGQIINMGRRAIAKPEVIISLQDERGNRLRFETGYPVHDVVPPGDSVPVTVLFTDPPPEWQSFEVFIQAKPATGREFMAYTDFSWDKAKVSQDEFSYFAFSGRVTNVGQATAEFVQVVISLYDQDDKIVGMGSAHVEHSKLGPGESSPFSVRVMNVVAPAASYRLQFVGHAR